MRIYYEQSYLVYISLFIFLALILLAIFKPELYRNPQKSTRFISFSWIFLILMVIAIPSIIGTYQCKLFNQVKCVKLGYPEADTPNYIFTEKNGQVKLLFGQIQLEKITNLAVSGVNGFNRLLLYKKHGAGRKKVTILEKNSLGEYYKPYPNTNQFTNYIQLDEEIGKHRFSTFLGFYLWPITLIFTLLLPYLHSLNPNLKGERKKQLQLFHIATFTNFRTIHWGATGFIIINLLMKHPDTFIWFLCFLVALVLLSLRGQIRKRYGVSKLETKLSIYLKSYLPLEELEAIFKDIQHKYQLEYLSLFNGLTSFPNFKSSPNYIDGSLPYSHLKSKIKSLFLSYGIEGKYDSIFEKTKFVDVINEANQWLSKEKSPYRFFWLSDTKNKDNWLFLDKKDVPLFDEMRKYYYPGSGANISWQRPSFGL